MINKKDVLLLLTDLEDRGVDCHNYINNLYLPGTNLFEILQFINSQQGLDLVNFYEKIRKSYNHKNSKLYKNIVQCDEQSVEDPTTVLTTLTALLNQIMQFKTEDKALFYKHSRADEIVKVLNIYLKDYDIQPAYKLLTLIKADLITGELINNRRN